MHSLRKFVMYFTVILSIVNVVICSHSIIIHVDLEGKVVTLEKAPLVKRYTRPETGNLLDWGYVVEKNETFDGADTGVLESIKKWFKLGDAEFEHLSNADVQKYAENAEIDIWVDGLRMESNKFVDHINGIKTIGHLEKAVETHVANHLVEKVFGGKMPQKVQFGVARNAYTIDAVIPGLLAHKVPVEGTNFRVILKKVEAKGENASQRGNGAQNGNDAQHKKGKNQTID